jgi:hypothetical protein
MTTATSFGARAPLFAVPGAEWIRNNQDVWTYDQDTAGRVAGTLLHHGYRLEGAEEIGLALYRFRFIDITGENRDETGAHCYQVALYLRLPGAGDRLPLEVVYRDPQTSRSWEWQVFRLYENGQYAYSGEANTQYPLLRCRQDHPEAIVVVHPSLQAEIRDFSDPHAAERAALRDRFTIKTVYVQPAGSNSLNVVFYVDGQFYELTGAQPARPAFVPVDPEVTLTRPAAWNHAVTDELRRLADIKPHQYSRLTRPECYTLDLLSHLNDWTVGESLSFQDALNWLATRYRVDLDSPVENNFQLFHFLRDANAAWGMVERLMAQPDEDPAA